MQSTARKQQKQEQGKPAARVVVLGSLPPGVALRKPSVAATASIPTPPAAPPRDLESRRARKAAKKLKYARNRLARGLTVGDYLPLEHAFPGDVLLEWVDARGDGKAWRQLLWSPTRRNFFLRRLVEINGDLAVDLMRSMALSPEDAGRLASAIQSSLAAHKEDQKEMA